MCHLSQTLRFVGAIGCKSGESLAKARAMPAWPFRNWNFLSSPFVKKPHVLLLGLILSKGHFWGWGSGVISANLSFWLCAWFLLLEDMNQIFLNSFVPTFIPPGVGFLFCFVFLK